MKLADIVKKLSENKTTRIVLIILCCVAVLLLVLSEVNKETPIDRSDDYELSVQLRLTELITNIEGAGSVRVMVTLEPVSGEIQGVAVVCSGGNSAVIRERIVSAVSAVLNISTARIYITKMED